MGERSGSSIGRSPRWHGHERCRAGHISRKHHAGQETRAGRSSVPRSLRPGASDGRWKLPSPRRAIGWATRQRVAVASAGNRGRSPPGRRSTRRRLDNRFLFETVLPALKKLKGRRQVIVATHDANIVVNGDADMVIQLEATANRGRVACSGAIEEPAVRDAIERTVDGGEVAFRLRRRKYGF